MRIDIDVLPNQALGRGGVSRGRVVGRVAVMREELRGRIRRIMVFAEGRMVDVRAQLRAPKALRKPRHSITHESKLVSRDPEIGVAAHAHDVGVTEEAPRHQRRAAALETEDENWPVDADLVDRTATATQRPPPTVAVVQPHRADGDCAVIRDVGRARPREHVSEPGRCRSHPRTLRSPRNGSAVILWYADAPGKL